MWQLFWNDNNWGSIKPIQRLYKRCATNEIVSAFNLSINWEEFLVFVMPTQDKHSVHIRRAAQIGSLAYKLMKTQQLPNTSTHQFTNRPTYKLANSKPYNPINSKAHNLKNLPNLQTSSTHKLTYLKTYRLKTSPTQKLKSLSFILQRCSNFHSVLGEILVKK